MSDGRGFVIPSRHRQQKLVMPSVGIPFVRFSLHIDSHNMHAHLCASMRTNLHIILGESQDCPVVPCACTIINNRQLGTCSQPTRRSLRPRDHFKIWRTIELCLALIRFYKSQKLHKFPQWSEDSNRWICNRWRNENIRTCRFYLAVRNTLDSIDQQMDAAKYVRYQSELHLKYYGDIFSQI